MYDPALDQWTPMLPIGGYYELTDYEIAAAASGEVCVTARRMGELEINCSPDPTVVPWAPEPIGVLPGAGVAPIARVPAGAFVVAYSHWTGLFSAVLWRPTAGAAWMQEVFYGALTYGHSSYVGPGGRYYVAFYACDAAPGCRVKVLSRDAPFLP